MVGTRKNRLIEAVLASTRNLCFRAKMKKSYTPVNPSFTIYEWGVSGSTLHGHVCMKRLGTISLVRTLVLVKGS